MKKQDFYMVLSYFNKYPNHKKILNELFNKKYNNEIKKLELTKNQLNISWEEDYVYFKNINYDDFIKILIDLYWDISIK